MGLVDAEPPQGNGVFRRSLQALPGREASPFPQEEFDALRETMSAV